MCHCMCITYKCICMSSLCVCCRVCCSWRHAVCVGTCCHCLSFPWASTMTDTGSGICDHVYTASQSAWPRAALISGTWSECTMEALPGPLSVQLHVFTGRLPCATPVLLPSLRISSSKKSSLVSNQEGLLAPKYVSPMKHPNFNFNLQLRK
jgi:hypothetical protein